MPARLLTRRIDRSDDRAGGEARSRICSFVESKARKAIARRGRFLPGRRGAGIVRTEQAGGDCGARTFDLDIEVPDVQHLMRIPTVLWAVHVESSAERLQ